MRLPLEKAGRLSGKRAPVKRRRGAAGQGDHRDGGRRDDRADGPRGDIPKRDMEKRGDMAKNAGDRRDPAGKDLMRLRQAHRDHMGHPALAGDDRPEPALPGDPGHRHGGRLGHGEKPGQNMPPRGAPFLREAWGVLSSKA